MKQYLKQFVSKDSQEEWQKLKSQMPWNFSTEGSELLANFQFEELDTDLDDEAEIADLIENSEVGTIWGEFFLEPVLSIGDDFYPFVQNCQQLLLLEQVPSLSNLSGLAKSDQPWKQGIPQDAVSFLVIACPRCQLIFTDGDTDEDFNPDDEDGWIDDSCPACNGSGEWVYELGRARSNNFLVAIRQ